MLICEIWWPMWHAIPTLVIITFITEISDSVELAHAQHIILESTVQTTVSGVAEKYYSVWLYNKNTTATHAYTLHVYSRYRLQNVCFNLIARGKYIKYVLHRYNNEEKREKHLNGDEKCGCWTVFGDMRTSTSAPIHSHRQSDPQCLSPIERNGNI